MVVLNTLTKGLNQVKKSCIRQLNIYYRGLIIRYAHWFKNWICYAYWFKNATLLIKKKTLPTSSIVIVLCINGIRRLGVSPLLGAILWDGVSLDYTLPPPESGKRISVSRL